jgi:hypothetical protein
MEVVCLISPFPSSHRVTKSKLPSDPLTEDSADLAADRPQALNAAQASRSWRRGPWLPIAVAALAAVLSVGMLNWLWQIKGRSAVAASAGAFTLDPDPPIVPPPEKELLKPSSGELPGRLPLDRSIEMLLSAAPAIPVVERHLSTNPRIAHWEIRFPSGNTVDTYARQLDALGIELGVIGGSDRIVYASGFTKDKPDRREGRADDEQRFYMTWRSGALRDLDSSLLSRAGIPTAERIIAQFYPPILERTLADLERKFADKRDLAEVRRTVFTLEPLDKSYEFRVAEQEYVSGELKKK